MRPLARTWIRRLPYEIFYRLPRPLRLRLARALSGGYVVSSVVVPTWNGHVLLIRQPPSTAWCLPAGLVQHGEAPMRTAIRELQEETGIVAREVHVRPLGCVVEHTVRRVELIYGVDVPNEQAGMIGVDGAEVLEARWFPSGSLPSQLTQATRLVIMETNISG